MDVSHHIVGAGDQDFGVFIALTESMLNLNTIFRALSQAHNPRLARPSNVPPLPAPTSAPLVMNKPPGDVVPQSSKPILMCGNCKTRGLRFMGHTDGTCFQPGGGMEG